MSLLQLLGIVHMRRIFVAVSYNRLQYVIGKVQVEKLNFSVETHKRNNSDHVI